MALAGATKLFFSRVERATCSALRSQVLGRVQTFGRTGRVVAIPRGRTSSAPDPQNLAPLHAPPRQSLQRIAQARSPPPGHWLSTGPARASRLVRVMATPDAVDSPAQLDADGAAAAAAGPSAAEQVAPQPNLSQGVNSGQKKAVADGERRSVAWNVLDRRAMLKAGLGPDGKSRSGSSAGRGASSCRFSFGGSSSSGKRFFGRVSSSQPKVSATAENAPAATAAGANGTVRRRAAPTQLSSTAATRPPPPHPHLPSRGIVDAGHWARALGAGHWVRGTGCAAFRTEHLARGTGCGALGAGRDALGIGLGAAGHWALGCGVGH
jgi:uncharacterized membrane protein YgcG